tara:strand:+ start:7296 stop:9092 length:1797 start_codon:yes stop_codon:yes gene_type:complete
MNHTDDGRSSTFGKELMTYISSKLPYSGVNSVQTTDEINPKYRYFQNTGTRRAEVLSKYSVSQSYDFNNQAVGEIAGDKRFSEIMYANIQKDKPARIRDYRVMAAFAEVSEALDEICDEIINKNSNGDIVTIKIVNATVPDYIESNILKEFQKFISFYELERKGWGYFRQLLVEGEIYFEHIIHEKYAEEGILGIIQMPSELIDPVYSNVQNVMVKGFLYRKPVFDPNNPLKQIGTDMIPIDKNQATYINSEIWNENKTMHLPFIENARRSYRQLSLVEDSVVIYRLVRAPERLVFNVDVGNMPAPKAEAYLRKLIQNYWSSKTFDNQQGGVVQKFNPQSMLDAFWFAKRTGSEGTDVKQLPGGANLGELKDLDYFVKKLFKSLKVPTSRLSPEAAYKDGADMLREELKFARFIIRLQQIFAAGLKSAFITHLQLKGILKESELKEQNIDISFNVPTNFYELRESQRMEGKVGNFTNLASQESMSPSYLQKKMLGWSEIDIKANREFLRNDKAFKWELAQIESMGPNWQSQMEAQASAAAGAAGPEGGAPPSGSGGGGGGGGGGMPPAFTGGEAATGGAEAPPPEPEAPAAPEAPPSK